LTKLIKRITQKTAYDPQQATVVDVL